MVVNSFTPQSYTQKLLISGDYPIGLGVFLFASPHLVSFSPKARFVVPWGTLPERSKVLIRIKHKGR